MLYSPTRGSNLGFVIGNQQKSRKKPKLWAASPQNLFKSYMLVI